MKQGATDGASFSYKGIFNHASCLNRLAYLYRFALLATLGQLQKNDVLKMNTSFFLIRFSISIDK